jgi:uncharacterized protein with PQ loop repeat
MQLVDILGAAAAACGVVMALAPLLQARRVRARRSGADVSQPFLAIIAGGATMWVAYGIAAANPYLIIPNTVAVATNLLTLALARRFDRSGHAGVARRAPSAARVE